MYTVYHLSSAQEVSTELLEAIKAAYNSKPIKIIVEEDYNDIELTPSQKELLYNRLQEDESTYLTSEESIEKLSKKYGV